MQFYDITRVASGENIIPPEEKLVEVVDGVLKRRMSRREADLLIGGGILTIAGITTTIAEIGINIATNEIWNHETTEFASVPGTGIRSRPEDAPPVEPFLVFDGLGRTESLTSARETADFLCGEAAAWIPIFGISRYSDKGIEVDKLSDWIQRSAKGRTGLNMVGVSKGTLEGLLAWAQLDNPPHMDNLIIIGSPSGIQDVYMQDVVEKIMNKDINPDLRHKLLFQLALSMDIVLNNGERSGSQDEQNQYSRRGLIDGILTAGRRAAQETVQGVSPALYWSGLQIVYNFQAAVLMQILRDKGAITPDTNIYYIKCPPENDKTVIVDQADNNFRQVAEQLHARYMSVIYDGGHAQAFKGLEALRDRFWEDQRRRMREKAIADVAMAQPITRL